MSSKEPRRKPALLILPNFTRNSNRDVPVIVLTKGGRLVNDARTRVVRDVVVGEHAERLVLLELVKVVEERHVALADKGRAGEALHDLKLLAGLSDLVHGRKALLHKNVKVAAGNVWKAGTMSTCTGNEIPLNQPQTIPPFRRQRHHEAHAMHSP